VEEGEGGTSGKWLTSSDRPEHVDMTPRFVCVREDGSWKMAAESNVVSETSRRVHARCPRTDQNTGIYSAFCGLTVCRVVGLRTQPLLVSTA
jgi:hypothetical protein